MTPIFWPAQPYIPGRTPRPEEAIFADVKASVRPGMAPEALAASAAWRTGLAYYEAGYFWEAHEVLEAVWMACPPNSVERRFVQALIQLANAALKLQMGRPGAAERLLGLAARLEAECRYAGRTEILGLPLDRLTALRAEITPSG